LSSSPSAAAAALSQLATSAFERPGLSALLTKPIDFGLLREEIEERLQRAA
jgi:hypothetical protein